MNDSNILSSNNNHYLDKIRLRELENKEKNRYQKIPKHILKMRSFSKQFQNIDYKYKQAK